MRPIERGWCVVGDGEPEVVDQRGLGIRETIVSDAGVRTPGPGETIIVEQPAAIRSTEKESK
jgi:hypothetical protein